MISHEEIIPAFVHEKECTETSMQSRQFGKCAIVVRNARCARNRGFCCIPHSAGQLIFIWAEVSRRGFSHTKAKRYQWHAHFNKKSPKWVNSPEYLWNALLSWGSGFCCIPHSAGQLILIWPEVSRRGFSYTKAKRYQWYAHFNITQMS